MLMSFNAEQSKKLGKGNGNKTAHWLLYLFPAKEESKMNGEGEWGSKHNNYSCLNWKHAR